MPPLTLSFLPLDHGFLVTSPTREAQGGGGGGVESQGTGNQEGQKPRNSPLLLGQLQRLPEAEHI